MREAERAARYLDWTAEVKRKRAKRGDPDCTMRAEARALEVAAANIRAGLHQKPLPPVDTI